MQSVVKYIDVGQYNTIFYILSLIKLPNSVVAVNHKEKLLMECVSLKILFPENGPRGLNFYSKY